MRILGAMIPVILRLALKFQCRRQVLTVLFFTFQLATPPCLEVYAIVFQQKTESGFLRAVQENA